jgi:damage-control phosphatase, subfamily I
MKFVPECLPCFVDDIAGALDMLHTPPDKSMAVLRESLVYLSDHIAEGMPPSYYITELHRILKRRLAMDMPFAGLRRACLKAGMEIARTVEKKASALKGAGRFRFLLRWATAANSLDFRTAGAGYGLTTKRAEKTIAGYFKKGLFIDQSDRILAAAKAAKAIVYIPDNVGELPFDKLLVGLLSSYGAAVTVPLRGGPITSDAVMADAHAVGMKGVASRLILAGPDTLGISFMEMSSELSGALSQADMVIAKGQANYYVLSEFGHRYPGATIACLFTAKCKNVWDKFGCEGKASIAAIIQNPAKKRAGPHETF